MRNQLYSPTGVQQQFYLTQLELYRNNFGKTIENTVGAAYTLIDIGKAKIFIQNRLTTNSSIVVVPIRFPAGRDC